VLFFSALPSKPKSPVLNEVQETALLDVGVSSKKSPVVGVFSDHHLFDESPGVSTSSTLSGHSEDKVDEKLSKMFPELFDSNQEVESFVASFKFEGSFFSKNL